MITARRLALVAAVFGCNGSRTPAPGVTTAPAGTSLTRTYRATVKWTAHGIPHVVADDLGSLAFGQGYAFATLHVCVLADQIIKLRSERAALFGSGDNDANIESDFGWLALDVRGLAERGLPAMSVESRAVLAGYAAGYNKYLADTKPDALPPDCANAAWVRPIDEVDLLAHWVQISMIGSSGYFLDAIAGAQPPGAVTGRAQQLRDFRTHDTPASNGWAIGAERSETGRGMLVANPHFPWEGELKFYESHLTIPGQLDAYGATLLGLPLVSIGFTEHVAWTHTFSSSSRFVIYRLTLDASDPTKYRYGDETRALTSRELAIKVRQPDGTLVDAKRKVYRSHHGPMIRNEQLGWNAQHAYTLRDVAGGNLGALDQYLGMMRAKDLPQFEAAFARHQATGFVNTIATDRAGNALYVDGSAVPDLSPSALVALQMARRSIPALDEAWKRGVVVADGSMPMFELETTPGSPRAGAVPYARAPRMQRRDFVFNANDSYWLTNPATPLTGFSPLYGETGIAPSARTRMNIRLLTATGDAAPSGADGKFSVAELQAAILDNRALTAELLRADVAARCEAAVRKKPDPKLAKACATLAAWDGRYDVGSKGAVLWREWLAAYNGSPYATPFDPAKPIETPRGLAPAAKGDDPIAVAMLAAIAHLERAGIDPFGTLGEAQFADKRGRKIPMPGSGWAEGATNPTFYSAGNTTRLPRTIRTDVINAETGLTKGGYPANYGTSFLMVVGFTDKGPDAHAILTYSASSDPRSPHFADQTEMYSRKEWRRVLFAKEDIEADPALRVQTVCTPRC